MVTVSGSFIQAATSYTSIFVRTFTDTTQSLAITKKFARIMILDIAIFFPHHFVPITKGSDRILAVAMVDMVLLKNILFLQVISIMNVQKSSTHLFIK